MYLRGAVIWTVLVLAGVFALGAAAISPLLAWRDPIYIAAGFAGIAGLALMLFQPLLVIGILPGVGTPKGRRLHRLLGVLLVVAVIAHIAGLWMTSPPDVIDVLLFRSPTPFGIWGAVAMWAVFAAGLLAVLRPRLPLRGWRAAHTFFVTAAVLATVAHALLIEGTMETVTKVLLCVLVIGATAKAIVTRKVWAAWRR